MITTLNPNTDSDPRHQQEDECDSAMDQYDALMTWYSQSLQLRRLIHCMWTMSLQGRDIARQQGGEILTHNPQERVASHIMLSNENSRNDNHEEFHGRRLVQQQQLVESRHLLGRLSQDAQFLMGHADTTEEQCDDILNILQDLEIGVENVCGHVQNILRLGNYHAYNNKDFDGGNDRTCSMSCTTGTRSTSNMTATGEISKQMIHGNSHNMHLDLDSASQLIRHVFLDELGDSQQEEEILSLLSSREEKSMISQPAFQMDPKHGMGGGAPEELNHDRTIMDTVVSSESMILDPSRNSNIHREHLHSSSHVTSEQMRREQEEMLQHDISEMAAQLKQSSLQIKSTLASQNKDLDQMETLAKENLDKTSQVTHNVTEHVRAGWKSSFQKWFVFFVILGTWFFCFLTIRVVPKRQGACLLFCNNKNTDGSPFRTASQGASSSKYAGQTHAVDDSDSHADTDTDADASGHGEMKTSDARGATYSYCQDFHQQGPAGKSQKKQCTVPLDPQDYEHSMGKIFNQAFYDPQHVAEKMIQKKKGQRMDHKLNLAKQEDTNIAASRVRDGWNGSDVNDKNHESRRDESHTHDKQAQELKISKDMPSVQYTRDDLKKAIFRGDIVTVQSILNRNPELAQARDENGWEAIHEAVRKGSVEATEILLDIGHVDINAKVGATGQGGSVLWIAKMIHGGNHEIIRYLIEKGATEVAPAR